MQTHLSLKRFFCPATRLITSSKSFQMISDNSRFVNICGGALTLNLSKVHDANFISGYIWGVTKLKLQIWPNRQNIYMRSLLREKEANRQTYRKTKYHIKADRQRWIDGDRPINTKQLRRQYIGYADWKGRSLSLVVVAGKWMECRRKADPAMSRVQILPMNVTEADDGGGFGRVSRVGWFSLCRLGSKTREVIGWL